MSTQRVFALLVIMSVGILAQTTDPNQDLIVAVEDLTAEISVSSESSERLAGAIMFAASQVENSTLTLEAEMGRLDNVLNRTISDTDLIRRSVKSDVDDIMYRGFAGIENTANNILNNRRFGKFLQESIIFLFFMVSSVIAVPIIICTFRLVRENMKHRSREDVVVCTKLRSLQDIAHRPLPCDAQHSVRISD